MRGSTWTSYVPISGYAAQNPVTPTRSAENSIGISWDELYTVFLSDPQRNHLILGGDFNSGIRAHEGLIGKGLLPSTIAKADHEFMALISEHGLCVLNTWRSARAACCATFQNGAQRSQLDCLMVRAAAADSTAKHACPVPGDLARWRSGPKHRMVQGSVSYVAGWALGRKNAPEPQYSKANLRWHLRTGTPQSTAFQAAVQEVVTSLVPATPIRELNQSLLQLCVEHFPAVRRPVQRPGDQPAVKGCLRQMWAMHRRLRATRPGASFLQVCAAWRRYVHFQRAWSQFRNASRRARRERVEELVRRAQSAAQRQDMREVYRVVQQFAPKHRLDRVRIRSADGGVLTQKSSLTSFSTTSVLLLPDRRNLSIGLAQLTCA